MSIVQCDRHGLQGGPHCCDHVRNAIYGKSKNVQYEKIACKLDKEYDYIIDYLICINCVNKFNLQNKEFIDEETSGNKENFPYTCPTCLECVKKNMRTQPIHNKPLKNGRLTAAL